MSNILCEYANNPCPECKKAGVDKILVFDAEEGIRCMAAEPHHFETLPGEAPVPTLESETQQVEREAVSEPKTTEAEDAARLREALEHRSNSDKEAQTFVEDSWIKESQRGRDYYDEQKTRKVDMRDSEVQQPRWVEDSPVSVHTVGHAGGGAAAHLEPQVRRAAEVISEPTEVPGGDRTFEVRISETYFGAIQAEAEVQNQSVRVYFQEWLDAQIANYWESAHSPK